jgi:hypothetical protein
MRVKKSLGNEIRRALAVGAILFCGIAPTLGADTNSAALFRELISLNPQSETNLAEIATLADRAAAGEKQQSKAEKKLARDSEDFKNLPTAELQKRFTENSAKQDARAISAIGRLAQKALRADDAAIRAMSVADISEIQAAIRTSLQSPVPEKLGLISSWITFFKNHSGTIGHGSRPAANLQPLTIVTQASWPPRASSGGGTPPELAAETAALRVDGNGDGGRNNPQPSTFWTQPASISRQNLYSGFGREQFPHLENLRCTYSAPKTSSGTHAGFDVEGNGGRFKIKFGDLNSEPFTARIFFALGYHVNPTDYAPKIEIHYDRRMLRELHLRKPLNMRVAPLGIHVWTIQLQEHFDPFDFIKTAVFKDSRQVSGAALKQMLFFDPNISHPEDSPANFKTDVEAALDYLVMAPANVQPRDGPTQSIGSWEFGGLGNEDRRELRGMGLLAAWLAWFDSRADNTKLRLVRDAKDVQLLHFVSDLGGGMGAGTGFFSPRGENPNELAWTFTAPEIFRGRGRMTTPFRIEHFKPTVSTPAFTEMTIDDAKWMARLIGQLTENQIRAALIASGYNDAASRLYLEKLISRRDKMIRDLKLESEIALLRPNGQNRDFSYTPSIDGRFTAEVIEAKVFARESPDVIFRGKILH